MNSLARAASAIPAMTRSFAQAAKNQKYYILMCKRSKSNLTPRRLCRGYSWEENPFPRWTSEPCQGASCEGNDVHDWRLRQPPRWSDLHFQGRFSCCVRWVAEARSLSGQQARHRLPNSWVVRCSSWINYYTNTNLNSNNTNILFIPTNKHFIDHNPNFLNDLSI